MPLEHAPSTETLFRSLQRDRARDARNHARQQRARAILRGASAAPAGHRLAATLRRLRSAAARAAGRAGDIAGAVGHPHSTRESAMRTPASHPGLDSHRSTTAGVPGRSCA